MQTTGKLLLLLVIIGILINPNRIDGQQMTATPEPTTLKSLFAEDTCAPPCWFGLTPGESIEEDIQVFLKMYQDMIASESYRDEFDLETEELLRTKYSLIWRDTSFFNPPRTHLTVENGVLHHIWSQPNREITFGEMLDAFGYPDYLYLGTVGYITLRAIYEETRITIDLYSPSMSCAIKDILSEFRVLNMNYFSPEYAEEVISFPTSIGEIDPQPRLLVRPQNAYLVPEFQLEQWLSGDETATCHEIWKQLHNETP